ncbi:hypothetical protein BJ085DRAFT_37085 [Dimargaris cristalligena]|uniref:Swiss Army Knife RNA repair protein HAD domain-containing protein n=1 Tax=Dimargaris cristalligena TaxID=215637 RepID=A0A4P9ZTB6_9FUNG|nr:hypothetical protein BJ085DRAFT_37085 [Dimargaris cristalligena]|eukprot:RKP36717.1 hypothetical protein BJ085DRAFT_37085 [Dimargaris cristalligena]
MSTPTLPTPTSAPPTMPLSNQEYLAIVRQFKAAHFADSDQSSAGTPANADPLRTTAQSDPVHESPCKRPRPNRPPPVRLCVFDFDNTLYSSPVPNRDLWASKAIGELLGTRIGWFHDVRTLSPPYTIPALTNYNPVVLQAARDALAQPHTLNIVLTGRCNVKFRAAVAETLAVVPDVQFDMVFLKCTPPRLGLPGLSFNDQLWEIPHHEQPVSTFDYKIHILNLLKQEFPTIQELHIWEDRERHKIQFQRYVDEQIKLGNLAAGSVLDFIPTYGKMPVRLERQLVESLVRDHNHRQLLKLDTTNRRAIFSHLTPSWSTMNLPDHYNAGSVELAQAAESKPADLSPQADPTPLPPPPSLSPSAYSAPASPLVDYPDLHLLELVQVTHCVRLQLDAPSEKLLARACRSLTTRYRPRVGPALLGYGPLPPAATAYFQSHLTTPASAPTPTPASFPLTLNVRRLGLIQGHHGGGGGGVIAELDLPKPLVQQCFRGQAPYFIVAKQCSPSELNKQWAKAEWTESLPPYCPLPIRARLVVEERTSVSNPLQPYVSSAADAPPAEPKVKVSLLIGKWHPAVQGRRMGLAIKSVEALLEARGIKTTLDNEAVIEDIVKELDFSTQH